MEGAIGLKIDAIQINEVVPGTGILMHQDDEVGDLQPSVTSSVADPYTGSTRVVSIRARSRRWRVERSPDGVARAPPRRRRESHAPRVNGDTCHAGGCMKDIANLRIR